MKVNPNQSRAFWLTALYGLTWIVALFADEKVSHAQSAPRPNVDYAITWIDPVNSPFTTTLPCAINDWGDAVGYGAGTGIPSVGWVWTADTGLLWAHEIATLPSGAEDAILESCKDITNSRVIVGNARIGGVLYPYRLPLVLDTTGVPIPQTVEFLNITGTIGRMSESGDIVTSSYLSSTNSVRWQIHRPNPVTGGYSVNTATTYGVAAGGSNNSAQIVTGTKSTDKDRIQRVYGLQYDALTGKSVKFPGFVTPGAYDTTVSVANAINDVGISVGTALFKTATKTVAGQRRAALFNGTLKPTDLGVLGSNTNSTAVAINNAGQVVGESGSDGFLWTAANKMHNLDSLVIPDLPWASAVSIQTNDINSPIQAGGFGEILGTAKFENADGSTYRTAFLLTPIGL